MASEEPRGYRTIKLEMSPEEWVKAEERGVFIKPTGYTALDRYDYIYRLEFKDEDTSNR